MKRKTIEAIPPLPATKDKRRIFYVAAVAVSKIKGEKTLIVDIYRNLKKELKTPIIRIALTEKDFGNYEFIDHEWDKRTIENVNTGMRQFITKESVAISEENERLILDNFAGYRWDSWLDRIGHVQADINQTKYDKKIRNRDEKLKERLKNMPPIPEQFYEWCEDELFKYDRYIFYKRKGRYAEFSCACCGKTYRYATERAESYEGQFEHVVAIPREGQRGRCEKCGTEATYKPIGRKSKIETKKTCYIIQKYGNDRGAVVRNFDIYKESAAGEKPVYTDCEINRSFFIPEMKKIQKDYCVHNGWTGVNEWWATNISGMYTIRLANGRIWPGSFEEIEGTMLQYSAIDGYVRDYDYLKVVDYMETYWQIPALEMIVKLGMYKLANKLVTQNWQRNCIDCNGNNAQEILMIQKCKIPKLVKERGSEAYHELLKAEYELGIDLKEQEEDELVELGVDVEKIKILLGFMSAKKIINRIYSYAGIEKNDDMPMCGNARSALRGTGQMYADYISMKAQAGYDMTNEINLHPRDLEAEHYKMVIETNKTELDKRMEEVRVLYKDIRLNYSHIAEIYAYQDETFIIRPAESAEEIVAEGKVLHHCVGGDSYLKNHARGKSYILFLRPVVAVELPYVTIEISGTKIVQWYGKNNKKPDEKNIQKWLNRYIKGLREGTLKRKMVAGEKLSLQAG